MSRNNVKTRELYLDAAAAKVAQMWREVAPSGIHRADANNTIHFVHEEASEVAKVAMKLGIITTQEFVRSEETESKEYTYADLVMEVGDVLLMALTLAQAFGLNPSVCLAETLRKFYDRAATMEAEKVDELRAHCDEPIACESCSHSHAGFVCVCGCQAGVTEMEAANPMSYPPQGQSGAAATLRKGIAIITGAARHAAENCAGFEPGGLSGYCKICGAAKELHTPVPTGGE